MNLYAAVMQSGANKKASDLQLTIDEVVSSCDLKEHHTGGEFVTFKAKENKLQPARPLSSIQDHSQEDCRPLPISQEPLTRTTEGQKNRTLTHLMI